MKTRLIFVRHGFSESNKEKKFTGQTDAPLADLGHVQARHAAEYLKDIHIDKIYSSPLQRAFDTAVPIAEKHLLYIVYHNGLCEVNGGNWENQPICDMEKISPEAFKAWSTDLYNCKCPCGESIKDFFERVKEAVIEIAEENAGKTICLTTHATPIRVISCLALGLEPERLQEVCWSPNASINIIDYEDKKFTFVKRNIIDHLEGMCTELPSNV